MLPDHAGKCSRLHGHSYRFEVAIRGPVQSSGPARGMIQDFDEIERIVDESVLEALDHRHLNDHIENPTVENIVLWIWKRLEAVLPGSTRSCSGKRQRPVRYCAAAISPAERIAVLALAEIFYSIQGEGTWTGTPAVFVRLAGCNLACDFCDTDYAIKRFAGIDEIVAMVRAAGNDCPMVVLTGGEPFAQAQAGALIDALRRDGRRVHVESNGTIFTELPPDVWLCVSPKRARRCAHGATGRRG